MTKNYGLARFLELHAANETDFQDFVIHGKLKVHKKMIDIYPPSRRNCSSRSFLCGKQTLRTRSAKAKQVLLHGPNVPL